MGHYSPWRHVRTLAHITIRWTCNDEELEDAYAWYFVDDDVILMDSRMSQVERRCVLAHEIHHALHHDEPCHHVALDAMQELRADQWASRKLIEIRPLGEALAWASCLDEAAEELWVTRDLLDVRLAHLRPMESQYLKRRLEEPHVGHTSTEGGPHGLG